MRAGKKTKEVKAQKNTPIKGKDKQREEYETMSQKQNRHGHGREHNGSDGSSNVASGSNH